jgi:hypothetical protein
MNCITTIVAIGLALAVALPTAPATALNDRSFVSPTGSDNNKHCSIVAPCRTFKAALAAINSGGEISVLGTADYGTLIINKAISIVNEGGFRLFRRHSLGLCGNHTHAVPLCCREQLERPNRRWRRDAARWPIDSNREPC